jgi:saccharopepsin
MFQSSITAIDTGSSLLVAPTDVAELINKELGAEKNWAGQVRYRQIQTVLPSSSKPIILTLLTLQYILDCAAVPNLPEFCFVFNGKDFCLTRK